MISLRRRTGIWCISGLLLLLNPVVLEAQQDPFDESWRWVHFTTGSDLPSNHVFRVIETPDSTLWAVTDAGIAWYDGFQWKAVPLPFVRPLQGNTIVFSYRRDSLLIGLDRLYAVGKYGSSRLSIPMISSSQKYFSGDSVLVVKDRSLYFQTGSTSMRCEMSPGSDFTQIHGIHHTLEGNVWITASDGIYRWEKPRFRRMLEIRGTPAEINVVTENTAGTAFVHVELPATMRGLWQFTPGSLRARRVTGVSTGVKAMAVGPSGELVVAYHSGELRILRDTAWESSYVLRTKSGGLHDLLFRMNGDLVLATTGGIHSFNASSPRWRVLRHGESGPAECVNEILTTRSGEIWLGTTEGVIVHGRDGTSRMISRIEGVPLVGITGLGEDRDGNVWVSSGASFDGAYRWNGSAWRHFQISTNGDGARFHRIQKDRRGALWFLGLSKYFPPPPVVEPGVFLYEDRRFVSWGKDHGLPNTRVYAFDEDAGGGLWFGTQDGISRWKDGAWRHWTEAEGLRSGRVFTVAVDRRTNVWFGHHSDGFGLGCIDTAGGITYWTTEDGLNGNRVWEVRVDSQDVVWITTDHGLAGYREGRWSRFDDLTGLPCNPVWPVLPLKDEVCVGTLGEGLAILNLREIDAPAPRVVIGKPGIDGQNVSLQWRAYSFGGMIPPNDIITRYRIDDGRWSVWSTIHELALKRYPHGEHTISVQAQGLFRNDARQVRSAAFTIPPPLYFQPVVLYPAAALAAVLAALGIVLIARKRRYDAELREREARFRAVTESTSSAIFIYDRTRICFMNSAAEILVGRGPGDTAADTMTDLMPPADRETFMKHWPPADGPGPQRVRSEIRIVTGTGDVRWLDFTSGPMIYHGEAVRIGTAFDITERKHADEKLRSLTSELITTEERERRRVAVYLHDVIGQALALCKIRLRSMQKAGSFAGGEDGLHELLRLVDDSITNTRSLTFNLSPPILYELNFPAALRSLTEELLEPHSIGLDFSYDGAPIGLRDEVKVVIYHVVREITVNCIKHARASRVTLALRGRPGALDITITDDGRGFDPAGGGAPPGSRHGFGLFNVRERLVHLGGTLCIQSGTGRGTTATISVPMDT